jgi:site-specific DNA-methyltransferase (adenine-specific)/adenine-specific DNA-methyltransferase
MNDEFRQMVIDRPRRGEALPADWARELFPPERREYELVYHGKEREEDILAETLAVPLQPVRTFGAGLGASAMCSTSGGPNSV